MISIFIKSIKIENFKGIVRFSTEFTKNVRILARNGLGKSSIFDAIYWCFFNSDSRGNSNFSIRKKNPDGSDEHFTDISVEMTIEVMDDLKTVPDVHIIKKTQKEKWVKKRGSESQEFQGNVNSYLIDGFPTKESDFKTFIENLIGAKLFKLLSDPLYFNELDWKERRQILMNLVRIGSFAEVAERYGGYDLLMEDLRNAPDLDAILKKYTQSKNELNKKIAEYPVRIDELVGMKTNVDVSGLEKKKAELEAVAKSASAVVEARQAKAKAKSEEIFEVTQKIAEITNNLRMESIKATSALRNEINQLQVDINTAIGEMRYAETTIQRKQDDLVLIEKNGTALNAAYKEWSSKELTEKDTTCPMCGQILPTEKISHMKEDLAKKKEEMIAKVKEQAAFEKSRKENTLVDIEQWKQRYQKHADMKKICEERMAEAQKELANTPLAPAYTANAEWVELNKKCEQLKAEFAELTKAEVVADDSIAKELEMVNAKLAHAEANDSIDARIAELRQEQQFTAQKVMDCEHMIALTEQFIKQYLDDISKAVNDKFDGVEFKLFETQINSGIRPTCETTVNGVPFKSVNDSQKILAGLRIIKTLQEIYQKRTFIVTDNAESIDTANRASVQMDNQMIWLLVSDDEQLKVEAN